MLSSLTAGPQQAQDFNTLPRITVIGVGGAGGNAVNNMIADGLSGVEFVIANTDNQALAHARTDRRIQLGTSTTQGLGAGAKPDVGRRAAEESLERIAEELDGSNMVFITAGMGGGTGTGAAPVVASVAREMGILTVGVVTKPFQFEGNPRMRMAEHGIDELSRHVDTLIVIPNQNLFRIANDKTTITDAFIMADGVLNAGVRSITGLIVLPGLVNLDFADVRSVMTGMGRAMMGTGEASGERRALDAAEAAINNPLLENTCMKGAKHVLINITGGADLTLFDVDEAVNRISDEIEGEAEILFGSCFDTELDGKMRVSVVATGIAAQQQRDTDGATTMVQTPARTTSLFRDEAPKAQDAPMRVTATAAPMAPAPAAIAPRPAPAPAPALAAVETAPWERSGAESAAPAASAAAAVNTLRRQSALASEAPRQQSLDIGEPAYAAAPTPATHRPSDAFIPRQTAAPAPTSAAAPAPVPAPVPTMPAYDQGHGPLKAAPRQQPVAAFSSPPKSPAPPLRPTAMLDEAPAYRDDKENKSLLSRITSKILGEETAPPKGTQEATPHPAQVRQAPVEDHALKANPEERPAAPRYDEEHLDIPPFLRNQAS